MPASPPAHTQVGRAARLRRAAGWAALGLLVLVTTLWTFWGTAEFYYEAWGLPWPEPAYYFVPAGVSLALTVAALHRPRLAAALWTGLGLAFSVWVFVRRWGRADPRQLLAWLPLTAGVVLLGLLLAWAGPATWGALPRARRWALALLPPLVTALAVSAVMLPRVLTRVDDHDRGARVIPLDGRALRWAPAGPGWNWRQPWGGYPSWDALAWYGRPPVGLKRGADLPPGHARQADMERTGLCRYLDASGTRLLSTPQGYWRLPTTAELVASLVHHGRPAGCSWDGLPGRAECLLRPDKETPLWAPDQPPIYYWSGEEYDADRAWYVGYTGQVNYRPKDWGNPRHGYRCVREAPPSTPGP